MLCLEDQLLSSKRREWTLGRTEELVVSGINTLVDGIDETGEIDRNDN
jgi:hypothetical protein